MRQFWNYADYFDYDSDIEGLKNYYGLCSFLDDNVTQVLTALEKSGQADNTQIIYTSDHGDMIGNHSIWGKCYMYEDSVGIPMILMRSRNNACDKQYSGVVNRYGGNH